MNEIPDSPEARNWATLCHLAVLAGFVVPFGHLLGPLVVWLMKRNEHPLVDQHGKDALNFQISVFIYEVSVILTGIVIAVIAGIALAPHHRGDPGQPPLAVFSSFMGFVFCAVCMNLVNVVLAIIAGIKASGGERFRYPLALPILR
jgi:uncharacterized Tic20 family protein